MGERNMLSKLLSQGKHESPNMEGKGKFINYTIKQKILFVAVFFICAYFMCMMFNAVYILLNGMLRQPVVNPLRVYLLTAEFSFPGILIIALISYFGGKLAVMLYGNTQNKDERGYKMTKDLEDASSKFLDRETKQKMYMLTDREHAYEGTILGEDRKTGEIIMLPFKPIDIDYAPANQHIAMIGSSGMRKTSSILINKVFTALAAGNSIVPTDPKKEISSETLAAALACGYKPMYFNLLNFEQSDGWDMLKLVREAKDPLSAADLMALVLISNSGFGTMGDAFWQEANLNCLKVHLLTVACAKGFTSSVKPNSKGNDRTTEALIALINSDDSEAQIRNIIEAGAHNGDRELLQMSFNNWAKHPQKDGIRSGLGTKLAIFQNKNLARILSEDEIDFKRLNDEKIILYVICSDQDQTYKSVLSLFMNFLLKEMSDLADSKPAQRLDRTLDVIMEEAKNIGKIVGIAQKVATLRSRGINLTFAYQDIGQMKDDYGSVVGGKYEWATILGNCATKLFLGGDDPETCKYFSEQSGKMFTDLQGKTMNVSAFNPIKWSPDQGLRTQPTEIPVLRPDQVKGIKPAEILILPQNFGLTIEKKFYYKKHPMYGYRLTDGRGNLTKFSQHPHIPAWRKEEIVKEVLATSGYVDNSLFNDELSFTYIHDFYKEDEEMQPDGFFNRMLYKAAPFLYDSGDDDTDENRNASFRTFIQSGDEETEYGDDTPGEIFEPENPVTEEDVSVRQDTHDVKLEDMLQDVDQWQF